MLVLGTLSGGVMRADDMTGWCEPLACGSNDRQGHGVDGDGVHRKRAGLSRQATSNEVKVA